MRNPHYLGLIKHKKDSYPSKHTAIIDRETWDKVQSLLDDNIQGKRRKVRATQESLFAGILFDAASTHYTPTHANKNDRRYRYYTSQAVIKKTEKIEKSTAPTRIPAHDLEKAVEDRILRWLQTPTKLLAALHDETAAPPEGLLARLVAQAAATAQSWRERSASDRTQFLKTVIERVVIHSTHVEIRLRLPALINEILGSGIFTAGLPPTTSIECPFRHLRQGRAVRLVVGDTNITTDASRRAILKAIARARLWYQQITAGETGSIVQLVALHGVSPRFIRSHFKLVQLSPQSIQCLMTRRDSMPLSLDDLLTDIPMHWNEQTFGSPAVSVRLAH